MWQSLLTEITNGDIKTLSRAISLIENESEGYEQLLRLLPLNNSSNIIGITGPPGAGKSTLADGLVGSFLSDHKKVAVLCVDPSSPFNRGALLGDRIRMSEWYNNKNIFIRSLASRGSLGGLHPKIVEITDLVRAAGFDHIIIETVGVGQSEVEIAGLADVTIVVLVPEGGDVIQTMKAGIMEIADIFVVNKSDRPGAESFINNLKLMLAPAFNNSTQEIPVLKTVATQKEGIEELKEKIISHEIETGTDKKNQLLTEKVFQVIQQKRMRDVDKADLKTQVENSIKSGQFNIYLFAEKYQGFPTKKESQ